MAYIDWDYYKSTFHAGLDTPISETEFPYYERIAEATVREATLGRADDVSEDDETAVKDCTCAVADKIKSFETDAKYTTGSAKGIESEKVGEYTVKYGGGFSAVEVESVKKADLYETMKIFLGITGLLYRGQ